MYLIPICCVSGTVMFVSTVLLIRNEDVFPDIVAKPECCFETPSLNVLIVCLAVLELDSG